MEKEEEEEEEEEGYFITTDLVSVAATGGRDLLARMRRDTLQPCMHVGGDGGVWWDTEWRRTRRRRRRRV